MPQVFCCFPTSSLIHHPRTGDMEDSGWGIFYSGHFSFIFPLSSVGWPFPVLPKMLQHEMTHHSLPQMFPKLLLLPLLLEAWTKALAFPKLYSTWQKAVIPVAKVINYEQIQCEKILFCFCVWLVNRSIYRCIENKIQIHNSDYEGAEISAFWICGYAEKLSGKITQHTTASILDCCKYNSAINPFLIWIYISGFPSAFKVLNKLYNFLHIWNLFSLLPTFYWS